MARTFDPCPNCGGEVFVSYDQYKETLAAFNADAGIEGEHGTEFAESDPKGDVGVCSRCGMAVGARGSDDAALAEPDADVQIPAESPEHGDDASGSAETPVHEVPEGAPV
jgi:hypothetical protein